MASEIEDPHDSVGTWAKLYYFANRAAVETVLRPWGLGSTQWAVLYQLANDGATTQRELGQTLHLERATLSGIVATLVRKGLIDQVTDAHDQRQRLLRMTDAGTKLWDELPDPFGLIRAVALDGSSADEIATAIRVLKAATQRVNDHVADGFNPGDAAQ